MPAHGPFSPEVNRAIIGAADRYGISRAAMFAYADIESIGGNPRAVSPSGGHHGLFQLSRDNQREFGVTDRFDPVQNANAAAQLLLRNRARFLSAMGREPTAAELYIMHQQGRTGGLAAIRAAERDPDQPATAIPGLPPGNVRANHGGQLTIGQFVERYSNEINRRAQGFASVYPQAVTNDGRALVSGLRYPEEASRVLEEARNPPDLFSGFLRASTRDQPVGGPDRGLPATGLRPEDSPYAVPDVVHPGSLDGLSIGSAGPAQLVPPRQGNPYGFEDGAIGRRGPGVLPGRPPSAPQRALSPFGPGSAIYRGPLSRETAPFDGHPPLPVTPPGLVSPSFEGAPQDDRPGLPLEDQGPGRRSSLEPNGIEAAVRAIQPMGSPMRPLARLADLDGEMAAALRYLDLVDAGSLPPRWPRSG